MTRCLQVLRNFHYIYYMDVMDVDIPKRIILDSMSLEALLKMKSVSKEYRDYAYPKLMRIHRNIFGATNKSQELKIKDLLLHVVYNKLKRTILSDELSYKLLSYGIGHLVNNKLPHALFRRTHSHEGYHFTMEYIGIASSLMKEIPEIATDIRICLNHYIHERDVLGNGSGELLADNEPDIYEHLSSDIQEPVERSAESISV